MGSLTLPASGAVYLDTSCVIYSVERISPYHDLLLPLWESAGAGRLRIVCSELVVLETLVKPLREKDDVLTESLRSLLLDSREIELIPIDVTILERAALLRARYGLKTPDALHAATALDAGVASIVTNDPVFRRVEGLKVAVLSEHATA
jgi:predicted nucleic acid-binding protein